MENVTDRTSNPFGMSPPCPDGAVFGYGDANADVHVVGDHPGVHGDGDVPFTGTAGGERLLSVLDAVGLVDDDREGDGRRGIVPRNCFLSYLYMCRPTDGPPTDDDYARLEPFFDAELRAITADVLVPVGDRALARVLEEYTSRAHRVDPDAAAHHAGEVDGRGFLVVPLRDPAEWTDDDERAAVERLRTLLASDYHQIADLGHFLAGPEPYHVR